jgi:hypothetical protein
MRALGYLFLICFFFIAGFVARGFVDDFLDYRKANNDKVLSEQTKGWWADKTKDIK